MFVQQPESVSRETSTNYEYEEDEDYIYEDAAFVGADPPVSPGDSDRSPFEVSALKLGVFNNLVEHSLSDSSMNSKSVTMRQCELSYVTRLRPYEVVDYEDIDQKICSVVQSIASVLNMHADEAQSLLVHNRWDEEKLIERYFSNAFKTTTEAGLDSYDYQRMMYWFPYHDNISQCSKTDAGAVAASAILSSMDRNSSFICKVCYNEFSSLKEGFSLGCGHVFCKNCFEMYLKSQVHDGPLCIIACCPEPKCHQVVTAAAYKLFLDQNDAELYDRYLVRNFIEANKQYRYCPAANCEKILSSVGCTSVGCTCGEETCFRCGEEGHQPCDCETVRRWTEKCRNDSETANWMLVNTKQCPKCHTRIEKNQGCNHMTCSQCRHEFCWICMADWRGHSNCNRYVPGASGSATASSRSSTDGKTATSSAEELRIKAKLELDRYMHYYQRFQAHDIALRFAIKQRVATAALLDSYHESGSSLVDLQFIRDAAELVISCRRILKYTYVMGFYMEKDAGCRQLFERHQEMLEENTETLHGFTEQKDLRKLDKQEVVNFTRITERFRDSLLEDITDDAIRATAHGLLSTSAATISATATAAVV